MSAMVLGLRDQIQQIIQPRNPNAIHLRLIRETLTIDGTPVQTPNVETRDIFQLE